VRRSCSLVAFPQLLSLPAGEAFPWKSGDLKKKAGKDNGKGFCGEGDLVAGGRAAGGHGDTRGGVKSLHE